MGTEIKRCIEKSRRVNDMDESKMKNVGKEFDESMKRFALIMAGIVLLLTIIFFPAREPGAVINLSTGEVIATPDVVKLTPAFGKGSRDELYSFTLAPDMDKYAAEISSSESVALVLTSVTREDNGDTSSEWSFAWGYWFVLDVITGAILSCVVLLGLRRRKVLESAGPFLKDPAF